MQKRSERTRISNSLTVCVGVWGRTLCCPRGEMPLRQRTVDVEELARSGPVPGDLLTGAGRQSGEAGVTVAVHHPSHPRFPPSLSPVLEAFY